MEIIKDFIKQHWDVFSSSWFNFVIAISFFVYVGTLFFYSKKISEKVKVALICSLNPFSLKPTLGDVFIVL